MMDLEVRTSSRQIMMKIFYFRLENLQVPFSMLLRLYLCETVGNFDDETLLFRFICDDVGTSN